MSFPRYPKYKESGVEWLGEVPEHWAVKRLRFAVELNPSKSELGQVDRGTSVSFLPMEAIGEDGSIQLERERPIAELESGYTYFRDGDVVFAKITPCFENGKGAVMAQLTNGVGFGTTELIVARPKRGEAVGPYLHYLFGSSAFLGIGESYMYGAGGQKRVPDSFVRDFVTAIPPVAEQGAMVAFLDRETAKIDELVAEQQRLMDLLKEKRQAVISHAVTKGLNPDAPMKPSGVEWLGEVPAHWEVKKLFYVLAEPPKNGVSPEVTASGSTPTFSIAAVRDGKVDIGPHLKFAQIDSESAASFRVRQNDILVLRGSGSTDLVGTAGIVFDTPPDGCIYPDILIRIRPNELILPAFLVSCLNSTALRPQIRAAAQTAAGIWKLSGASLQALRLPLPPIEEQRSIARYINGCDERISAMTTAAKDSIAILQERRAVMIALAVTGQIDVRHLAQEAAA